MQTSTKELVFFLALAFLLGEGSRAFARNDDPEALNQQALKLYQQDKFQEAILLEKKELAMTKRALGPDHPLTAAILNNLGRIYTDMGAYTQDMGAYAQAEPLLQQALQINKKVWGSEHPDMTAKSLNSLAILYETMGDYTRAESFWQQALQIYEKALGPEHPDTAQCLAYLVRLYRTTGAYAKAEPLCQQALRIREKVLGPEHPDTADSLIELAFLYHDMGAYAQAEPLYQRALQIFQKAFGPENPRTADALKNLGRFYVETGDYAKAKPLLEQALRINEKATGSEQRGAVTTLLDLASLQEEMGDYARAESHLQQAVQICQKALGPEHPDTALSLQSLALVYMKMGAYSKAESPLQQGLQIYKKAFGLDHPRTAIGLNNLAGLYVETGAYAKAESPLQQALQIYKKAFGLDHPRTAMGLNNLAGLYVAMGDYAKGQPLYQQALQIYEKVLGPEHPDTAMSLENLGVLKCKLGELLEAKSLAQESAQVRLALLAKVLSFTSEQQRLAYQATLQPYSLFALLDHSDAELAATVLRCKGVVLDSLIEDRLVAETSKTPEDRDLLARLTAAKRQLGQLLLQSSNRPAGEVDQKVETLEREVEQIEGRLAQHVVGLGHARRALSVTVEQVQAAIPKDGALIEYLRYAHYLGEGRSEPRYGAVMLAATGPPRWLTLGNAKDVDAMVGRYQRLVHEASDSAELSENLEGLYGQLWEPIEHVLPPELRRVIISPDGGLNFISFATLLDSQERFLAEKYIVQYVASGRDLLRDPEPSTTKDVVLFANPAFDLTSSARSAQADPRSAKAGLLRGSEKQDIEDWRFGSLTGTQKESDELIKKFVGWGWTPTGFTANRATKAALLKVHSPYILHFATHGFFANEDPTATQTDPQASLKIRQGVTQSNFFKNPMHRSGLALAGAQTTLEAWKRGEVPPIDNDGIVTAEDMAALDLKGTWLVTLSACDTGSGEAKAGEGVLGLRRGFLEAGAQNLLMTLWPISDETTVQIMTDFYDVARKTANPPQALAQVQRDWLVKLRQEHGLTQAVRLAGPFIMSSQGKP